MIKSFTIVVITTIVTKIRIASAAYLANIDPSVVVIGSEALDHNFLQGGYVGHAGITGNGDEDEDRTKTRMTLQTFSAALQDLQVPPPPGPH